MTKKIIKLAVIRSNELDSCPFGLDISSACQNVGNVIDRMAPLDILGDNASDEEKKRLTKANQYLLKWQATGKPCKYAANLFPEHEDKVDCSYGDTAAGMKESGTLLGSPYYSQHFSGISLDGLFSYPLGFLSDSPYDAMRNSYYSIMSLQGSEDFSDIILHIAKALENEE